ncbi:MAG: GNAT family N-acetyltransferase [Burkholderiales bacterium]
MSFEDEPLPQIPTRFTAESFTLGAFADSRLVGTVSLERDAGAKLKHKALLFRMFVRPDAAGHGTGKALLKAAIAHAELIPGLRQLYLTVLARNERARNLYASLGFQIFAHEPEAVNFEGVFADEYRMVFFFKASQRSS